jgi:hypothetical protein
MRSDGLMRQWNRKLIALLSLDFFLLCLLKKSKKGNITKDVLQICPCSFPGSKTLGHKPMKPKRLFLSQLTLRIFFFHEECDPYKFGTLTRFDLQIQRKFFTYVDNLFFFSLPNEKSKKLTIM